MNNSSLPDDILFPVYHSNLETMNFALTNYGLRFAAESVKEQPLSKPNADPSTTLLNRLKAEILIPYRNNSAERDLVSRQLAEPVPDMISRETIALRYKRNPLEYVKQIAFEFTSRCNLHCRHCSMHPSTA